MKTKQIALASAVGALCACLAASGPAAAQGKGRRAAQDAPQAAPAQPQPPSSPPMMGRHGRGMGGGRDRGPSDEVQTVIMEAYYPPELVREHAEEIQLTDGQIDKLRKATSDVRNEVDQLEWDVARESRKLAKLLRDGAAKEQVYAQMDAVFAYENKIKKKMLGMLIVVRDVLTTQQRAQLDAMKAAFRESRGGRGRGMGGGRPGFPPGPPPPPDEPVPGPAPEGR